MAQPEARNRANLIISVILIGMGVLILLGQVLHIGSLWPLFIIVPGLLFFVGMAFGGKTAGPLAIPGSIVTMVGVILLVQSWLDYFRSWAYAWALIIVAVGIGFQIHSYWSGDQRASRSGQLLIRIGIIIFAVLGAFFELIFNLSDSSLGGFLWPVIMIAAGIYLLARRAIPQQPSEIPYRTVDPTPPKPPTPPAPPKPPVQETQFEPLDMSRGRRGTRSKTKTDV